MSKNLISFVEAAIFASLAMILSFIPDFASWFSPSFGAIPLVVFSLRRGTKYGLLAGLLWGLLHFALGKVYYLALSQVLIEYILAFLSMGIAGLLATPFQKKLQANQNKQAFITGALAATLAVLTRYFWHFLAGVIFWGSYAPKGTSVYWYSFVVNGTAGLATLILVLVSLALLITPQVKSFFLAKGR